MTACSIDYFDRDFKPASYTVVYAVFVFFLPLLSIAYHYCYIVKVSLLFNKYCS